MSRRRDIERMTQVNIPRVSFEDLVSAPRRLGETIEHIEKIPILGKVVKGAEEVIPELTVAREALATTLDVQKVLKDTFGVDVEHQARKIDDFLDVSHSNTVNRGYGSMLRGLDLTPPLRMEFQKISHSHATQVGDSRGLAHSGQAISQA